MSLSRRIFLCYHAHSFICRMNTCTGKWLSGEQDSCETAPEVERGQVLRGISNPVLDGGECLQQAAGGSCWPSQQCSRIKGHAEAELRHLHGVVTDFPAERLCFGLCTAHDLECM